MLYYFMGKKYTRKLYFYQIICALVFTLYGCNTNKEPTNSNDEEIQLQPIIIDQSLWQEYVVTAPYKYSIENMEINGDTLKVNISYTGGCKEHEFSLIGSDHFAYTNPLQAFVAITQNTYDDSCSNDVSENLMFDLLPLQDYIELPIDNKA